MFGRRRKGSTEDLEPQDRLEETDGELGEDAPEDGAEERPAAPARPQGPWDVDDAPADQLDRLDLGGMRVPVLPGTDVRVDLGADGEVVAATLVQGPSSMQVNAFAAPKTSGIWDEVRTEIARSITTSGGRAQDIPGPHGPELFAAVPVQGGGAAPARFIGVDGPRWFLRALLTGPAAQDRKVALPLERALRAFVVVRGAEAMAVRDPLPLKLPREAAEQLAARQAAAQQQPAGQQPAATRQAAQQPPAGQPPAAAQQPADQQPAAGQPPAGQPPAAARGGADSEAPRPTLPMPERGPEITETR